MVNVKIVLHRIIFCSTYRQNTHSQRRPKQPTMTSGSGSSWAWSRMGLLSSRELGLLPLMIAPCCVHCDAARREATTFRVVGYGVFSLYLIKWKNWIDHWCYVLHRFWLFFFLSMDHMRAFNLIYQLEMLLKKNSWNSFSLI
jgi:hypothetical protein